MEDFIVKLSSFIKCNYEPNSLTFILCIKAEKENNKFTNKIKNKIITINDNNFFNNKTVLSRINIRGLLLLLSIIIGPYSWITNIIKLN